MDGLKTMLNSNNLTLLQGDALELFNALESDSVDLIIADPPYNLGKNYGVTQDNLVFEEYLTFSRQWLTQAKRVLKPTGTIYVFMGVRFISYLFQILEQDLDLQFNSWICWHYTQGIGKTRGFSPRHDDILMFTKNKNHIFNVDAIKVPQKYYRERNNMRGANPGDVWQFSHVHYCQKNRQPHPTQKPEGLIERMMLASSNEQDLIIDPFSGSGTTLRVAQQLNRKAIGFEINPDYIQQTTARLAQPFTGFDSVDSRMERVPLDLRDENIRTEYLQHHIEWFLKNHPDSITLFQNEVAKIYGAKTGIGTSVHNAPQQTSLF
jgi:DNA modification methylase